MMSVDVKLVKQQDEKELFIRRLEVQCKTRLILLDIPSSLILSIRNRGWEVLRNRQTVQHDEGYLPMSPWYKAANKNK